MANDRWDGLGKVALGLCLGGMILGITVGIMAQASPRNWTMRDAGNTLTAAEGMACFIGVLSRRSRFGASALVIGGVIALASLLFSP